MRIRKVALQFSMQVDFEHKCIEVLDRMYSSKNIFREKIMCGIQRELS